MAPLAIRERLKLEIDRPENRGYADNGIAPFKEAAAEFLLRQFDVRIDPVTEVCHAIGSKPAYAMLPACFINPGDVTLLTVPGYPVAGTHTRYYGGDVHKLPLTEANGFLPDLDNVPDDIRSRAKLLILNYPNSPTGTVATRRFYDKVVRYAHDNSIVVVQDAAHIMLTYGTPPLSFLQIDGAKDVGVEVHSLSKGFNMIGWRIGFVAGHKTLVQAYADVKDNSDSGQFMAVQMAAAEALSHDDIPQMVRAKYQRRLQKLVAVLNTAGFDATMPGGTYFLYVKAPISANGIKLKTAEDASQLLIREQSLSCVPWDDAGSFLRFSVTYSADGETAEDDLMRDAATRLTACRFEFA